MKKVLMAILVSVMSFGVCAIAEPVSNQNCVKKDKKGNCPQPPASPKPTPKKKIG